MLILSAALLVASSFIGAYMSVKVRAGSASVLWMYLMSVFSTTAWVLLMKSNVKLTFAAMAFDLTVVSIYLLVMIFMGEKMTYVHAIGAFLGIAGMALMSS